MRALLKFLGKVNKQELCNQNYASLISRPWRDIVDVSDELLQPSQSRQTLI